MVVRDVDDRDLDKIMSLPQRFETSVAEPVCKLAPLTRCWFSYAVVTT